MLACFLMSPYSSLYPRSLQIHTKEGKQNKQLNVQQPLCPFTYCVDTKNWQNGVFLCVIQAELQSAILWFDSAAPQRLQHFGHCVTSPVAVTATTWSCHPNVQTGLVRGGQQDYMEILAPLCPGVALVMDDPVNVCDCRAGWPATGVAVPACTFPSIFLLWWMQNW